MSKIIGISGRKQSGKNTVANYIAGDILMNMGMISNFNINDLGQLQIETINNNNEKGWGVFDITRRDKDFVDYADNNIWPYIKIYHFADVLKKMCVDLFDLTPEQVYGSDDQKNTLTPYNKTAREFLQYFGTDVMRKIKDTIWVDCTIKKIKEENSLLSIIPDVRFPNEVNAIHDAGGIVIRLTRNIAHSTHHCECALDEDNFSWDNFDKVIDNNNLSIKQLSELLSTQTHIWRQSC